MENSFGETIERVRKQKNITITRLVEGIMSPSTYHRFKKGEIETSITKFSELLVHLNLRYDEFLFIHNRYQNDEIKESLLNLENLFNKKDTVALECFQNEIIQKEWENSLAQHHIHSLTGLLKNHLSHQDSGWESNDLIHYLEKTETWTHYEVAMFNNCMKVLPTQSIDFFLKNVIHSFLAYRTTAEYNHEISRIIINAIISFLSRKETKIARKWYNQLSTQQLGDHFLFENFFIKLLGDYLEFVEGNEDVINYFPKYIEYLEFLECRQLAQSVLNMNKWMIANYGEKGSL